MAFEKLLLETLCPLDDPMKSSPDFINSMRRSVGRTSFRVNCALVLSMVLTGVLLWLFVAAVRSNRASPSPSRLLLVQPEPAMGVFAVVMVAVALPGVLLFPTLRAALPNRHRELTRYWSLRNGYNFRRATWLVCLPILIGGAVLLDIAVSSQVQFDSTRMTYRGFPDFGLTTRPYSTIARIVRVSKHRGWSGNPVDRPHYILWFADGTKWTNKGSSVEQPASEYDRVMPVIAGIAGKQVEFIEFAPP